MMRDLVEEGLKSVTFSVLSFDPNEFLKTQHIQSISWALAMIQREKQNILLARDLGIGVKINTVVLAEADYNRVDSVREFAESSNIKLVLLPSLGDQEDSQPAVFDYAQKHGEYIGGFEHSNNSKGSRFYKSPSGLEIDAKYTTHYHPEIVCGGCELRDSANCYEKFYGIRMEFRDGNPYIRLCIQKTNERTVMPLSDFINKDIANQL